MGKKESPRMLKGNITVLFVNYAETEHVLTDVDLKYIPYNYSKHA